MTAVLLACDWGTTNLRAWTLDGNGSVIADRDFPGLGVAQLSAGDAERVFREQVRPAMNAVEAPAILCGMVGSNLGWVTAPYVDCPASLNEVAGSLARPADDAWIVPGVRSEGFNGQGDVMRGEETQLFGWLAADPQRGSGRKLVCHPGTHAKWMVVDDGRLTAFVTAMTGELFSVLRRHSVLKSDAEPDDQAAFAEGLAAAGEGGALAARLFTARSRVVGMGKAAESTPSYLSGLLIGAEVAAVPRLLDCSPDQPVDLLGDAALCALYDRALRGQGVTTHIHDGEAAAAAGLFVLYREGTKRR